MTAADLLARLAQRPPAPEPCFTAAFFDYMQRKRAEFDRALLLDAWEYRNNIWEQRHEMDETSDWHWWSCKVDEAEAALRTIVTTLRSEP
jgi:hypothetical protein